MRGLILFLITAMTLGVSHPAVAANPSIKGDGKFGCTAKKDYNDIMELAAQNDEEAFNKLLSFGLSMGECVMFKANEPVVVTSVGLLTSQVRRKGDPTRYWTSTDAMQMK